MWLLGGNHASSAVPRTRNTSSLLTASHHFFVPVSQTLSWPSIHLASALSLTFPLRAEPLFRHQRLWGRYLSLPDCPCQLEHDAPLLHPLSLLASQLLIRSFIRLKPEQPLDCLKHCRETAPGFFHLEAFIPQCVSQKLQNDLSSQSPERQISVDMLCLFTLWSATVTVEIRQLVMWPFLHPVQFLLYGGHKLSLEKNSQAKASRSASHPLTSWTRTILASTPRIEWDATSPSDLYWDVVQGLDPFPQGLIIRAVTQRYYPLPPLSFTISAGPSHLTAIVLRGFPPANHPVSSPVASFWCYQRPATVLQPHSANSLPPQMAVPVCCLPVFLGYPGLPCGPAHSLSCICNPSLDHIGVTNVSFDFSLLFFLLLNPQSTYILHRTSTGNDFPAPCSLIFPPPFCSAFPNLGLRPSYYLTWEQKFQNGTPTVFIGFEPNLT